MGTVLIPIPDRDFDPVVFATESGAPGVADDIMVTGRGLDFWSALPVLGAVTIVGRMLRANEDARRAYQDVLGSDEYRHPALYPALPIGNNGAEDRHEIDATRLSVIAAGMRYKHQFDLQENGIRGGAAQPSDFGYTQVRNHCGEIVTGLQNSKSATDDPAYQGPLNNALDHVLAAGVDFWEVYVSDIDNPSMTDVLKRASSQLPAHSQCRH
jgi:hypothetical protein